jgi:hypothetical protein
MLKLAGVRKPKIPTLLSAFIILLNDRLGQTKEAFDWIQIYQVKLLS